LGPSRGPFEPISTDSYGSQPPPSDPIVVNARLEDRCANRRGACGFCDLRGLGSIPDGVTGNGQRRRALSAAVTAVSPLGCVGAVGSSTSSPWRSSIFSFATSAQRAGQGNVVYTLMIRRSRPPRPQLRRWSLICPLGFRPAGRGTSGLMHGFSPI